MSDTRPPSLHFELDDLGMRLSVSFDPSQGGAPPAQESALIEALEEAGFGDLYRFDDAMAGFMALAASASSPVRMEIAQRRDGECKVVVADDAMNATLEVTPAFGGEPVGKADVDRALAAAGVVHGVDDDRVRRIMSEASGRPCVIARGRAAQPGKPAEFQSLVPDARQQGPRVDARGIAHYRELGTLVCVHAGDPLMRRIPPTPGVDGVDVRGGVVAAPAYDDTPFSPRITGTSPSANDANVLVADIAGQPVFLPDGVSVLPTIEVATVDLTTGNVDFDGTVTVTGHVASGMEVVATGDVFIGGHVEAAHVEAGGNVSIAAGAIGWVDAHDPCSGLKARLVAGGTVSVQFCEHAVVRAGGDVQIGEVSLHSELTAGGQILVGKPGGRRSQLIGGVARCSTLLQVGTLGSTAAVGTVVEVGFDPAAHERLHAVEAQLDDVCARLVNVQQALERAEALGDSDHAELRDRAQRTLAAVEDERVALLEGMAAAQAQVSRLEQARIEIRETVHPNVEVRIYGRCFRTRESAPGRVYELREGEIVLGDG